MVKSFKARNSSVECSCLSIALVILSINILKAMYVENLFKFKLRVRQDVVLVTYLVNIMYISL